MFALREKGVFVPWTQNPGPGSTGLSVADALKHCFCQESFVPTTASDDSRHAPASRARTGGTPAGDDTGAAGGGTATEADSSGEGNVAAFEKLPGLPASFQNMQPKFLVAERYGPRKRPKDGLRDGGSQESPPQPVGLSQGSEGGSGERPARGDVASADGDPGRARLTEGTPGDPDDLSSSSDDDAPDRRRPKKPFDYDQRVSAIRNQLPSKAGERVSYAISTLTKMYTYDTEKYGDEDGECFMTFQTLFLSNLRLACATSEEAAAFMHRTLRGSALMTFLATFGATRPNKVEILLAKMGGVFANEGNWQMAYSCFMRTKFEEFRNLADNQDISERAVVDKFHTKMLSSQFILGKDYSGDLRLLGRLVDMFSEYSPKVEEIVFNKRPENSADLLVQLRRRASSKVGIENLPAAKAGRVLESDVSVNYLDNRLKLSLKASRFGFGRGRSATRGGRGSRRDQTRGGSARGPARGCWVCGQTDHYAHQRRAPDEIAKARASGRSVFNYASSLPRQQADRVTRAYIADLEPHVCAADGLAIDEEHNNAASADDAYSRSGSSEDDADAAVVEAEVLFTDVSSSDPATVNATTCQHLADRALVSSLQATFEVNMQREIASMNAALADANDRKFGGIVIDTACTGASVISEDEYRRYCNDTGASYAIDASLAGYVSFGDSRRGTEKGRVLSLGMAEISEFVATFDEVFRIRAHVVPGTDTPCLMSLQDLEGLGYELRTGSNTLWSQNRDGPVVGLYPVGPHILDKDRRGRSVLDWDLSSEALFTTSELKSFHRAYGHESAQHVIEYLREAGYDDIPDDTKVKLEEVARNCDPCQRNATKPKHFSISLKWKGCRLNHRVLVDVMSTVDGDVVHVLDRGTRFNAALHTATRKNPSAREIWAAIKLCWIDVYVGPPDILQFDQGSAMTSSRLCKLPVP